MGLRTVAVTLGDPAGVGPEIAVRALEAILSRDRSDASEDGGRVAPELRPEGAAFVLVGDAGVIEMAGRRFAPTLTIHQTSADSMPSRPGVYVLDVPYRGEHDARGLPIAGSSAVGLAAYDSLETATALAIGDRVGAIVTGPLNKEALARAGHVGIGHTELLADFCGVPRSNVAMLLASDRLRVAHVSTHVALREALDTLNAGRIAEVGRLAAEWTEVSLGRRPKMAVAGVNPHAGEGGLFGTEEIDHVIPAVKELAGLGIDVTGPIPPDTVFARAIRGEFDVVLAMYHDQGHIPSKLLGFADTVNVTLGLPITRVSVDHGTAYDIAWAGTADFTNMMVALVHGLGAVR